MKNLVALIGKAALQDGPAIIHLEGQLLGNWIRRDLALKASERSSPTSTRRSGTCVAPRSVLIKAGLAGGACGKIGDGMGQELGWDLQLVGIPAG